MISATASSDAVSVSMRKSRGKESEYHRHTFWAGRSLPHRAGGLTIRRWSFYIFSGGSTADKLLFRGFDLEFLQKFGIFRHLLT